MSLSELEKQQFRDLDTSRVGEYEAAYEIRDLIMSKPQTEYTLNGRLRVDLDPRWMNKMYELWTELIEEGGLTTATTLQEIMNDWRDNRGYALPGVIIAGQVLDDVVEEVMSSMADIDAR
jgi:hypothetical protein